MADITPLRRKPTQPEEAPGYGCGAVVQLRSGGAKMTVREAIRGSAPMVRCDWHLDGEPTVGDYFVSQLKRVEELDIDVEMEGEDDA